MTFWTSLGADPKRAYRFQATISGMGAGSATYYIMSVTKPGLKIASKQHMYLGHKFNYPGLVSWDPPEITLKMIDPVNPDSAQNLMTIIQASGYIIPKDENSLRTVSKNRAVTSLGGVTIRTIDEAGNEIESWTLKNAYISGVKFGDLDYSKDDILVTDVMFTYDWCELKTATPAELGPQAQLQATVGGVINPNERFKPQ